MKKGKIIIALALCFAMILTVASCSMVSVDEEKRGAKVVAKVNDKEITTAEYESYLSEYISAYGMGEEYLDADSNDETVKSVRQAVLEEYVNREVKIQYAQNELGGLTDEEISEAETNVDSNIEYLEQIARNAAENEAKEDDTIDVDALIQEKLDEYMGDYTREDAIETAKESALVTKFEEEATKDVNVTDDDVKEYYDLNVENQLNTLKDNPKMFSVLSGMGTVYVYPDDVRAVQNLLIGFDEDTQTEISSLRSAGDEDGANALRDEKLAEIQAEADEVLAKVEAGEDFETLIKEYGDDPGMEDEDTLKKGYYVYTGASFVDEFKDAALALENVGDTTGLVASDYGYHIIKLISFPDQAKPYEEMESTVRNTLETSAKTTAINNLLETAKEGMTIEIYSDRV